MDLYPNILLSFFYVLSSCVRTIGMEFKEKAADLVLKLFYNEVQPFVVKFGGSEVIVVFVTLN